MGKLRLRPPPEAGQAPTLDSPGLPSSFTCSWVPSRSGGRAFRATSTCQAKRCGWVLLKGLGEKPGGCRGLTGGMGAESEMLRCPWAGEGDWEEGTMWVKARRLHSKPSPGCAEGHGKPLAVRGTNPNPGHPGWAGAQTQLGLLPYPSLAHFPPHSLTSLPGSPRYCSSKHLRVSRPLSWLCPPSPPFFLLDLVISSSYFSPQIGCCLLQEASWFLWTGLRPNGWVSGGGNGE